jgi:transposase
MSYQLFVGVDIAAKTATVQWRSQDGHWGAREVIAQTPAAYATLVAYLDMLAAPQHTLVVMEATGTYWQPLAWALYQAGLVVSVVNPAQPCHFARMRLQRAKTDAIDAHLLADFAACVQPAPWTPPPPVCEKLHQRLALREDFLKTAAQDRNRLHALRYAAHPDPTLLARLETHLAFLQAQVDDLTREIAALLEADPAWAVHARHLRSVPGLGPIATAWILVATQAFARCDSPEQAASFAGLAPHARDSGTSLHGHRSVGGAGHAALRRALYMAAASACRFNPAIQPFYQRLLARGKPKKLAQLAAARKLLHLAWAVVVKHSDFDPALSVSGS